MKVKLIDQRIDVLTPFASWKQYFHQAELFGRVCYKSEAKITAESYLVFINRIIKNGHESVLEHFNISIKFTTDRAMANCLVRHRHCAFSQESTHYINYLKKNEIQIIKQQGFPDYILMREAQKIIDAYENSKDTASRLRRSLLPLCLKTELIVTTNIREWRHILKIRTAKGCHPQMHALMSETLRWFKVNLHIFVKDIGEKIKDE